MSDEFIASTAKEQLRRWDAGDTIWSIEMGGLGPGYEQAIQVLAIELIRDNVDKPLPNGNMKIMDSWGDDTVKRVDDACGGFSGAQVGAAKQIAYRFLTDGPARALKQVKNDRHIQVSNFWPRVEATHV